MMLMVVSYSRRSNLSLVEDTHSVIDPKMTRGMQGENTMQLMCRKHCRNLHSEKKLYTLLNPCFANNMINLQHIFINVYRRQQKKFTLREYLDLQFVKFVRKPKICSHSRGRIFC